MSGEFDEAAFRSKVNRALTEACKVLESNRTPQLADVVPHSYDDKFVLAENLINTAASACSHAFLSIGITHNQLEMFAGWASKRTVSLVFRGKENTKFNRKEEYKVESPSHVTEVSVGSKVLATKTDKVITTVRDYYWDFEANYEIVAICGVEDTEVIASHCVKTTLKTSSDKTPHPVSRIIEERALDISWLLHNANSNSQGTFTINRNSSDCRTPRRNPDVEKAITYFKRAKDWAHQVFSYLQNSLLPIEQINVNIPWIVCACDSFHNRGGRCKILHHERTEPNSC